MSCLVHKSMPLVTILLVGSSLVFSADPKNNQTSIPQLIEEGLITERETVWATALEAKHSRIQSQLEKQSQGERIEIERYSPEEIAFSVIANIPSINTVRLQETREKVTPLSIADALEQLEFRPLLSLDTLRRSLPDKINQSLANLAELNGQLRTATIEDDEKAIASVNATIRKCRAELDDLIDNAVGTKNEINPKQTVAGDIGTADWMFTIERSRGVKYPYCFPWAKKESNAVSAGPLRLGGNLRAGKKDGDYLTFPKSLLITIGERDFFAPNGASFRVTALYVVDTSELFSRQQIDSWKHQADEASRVTLTAEETEKSLAAKLKTGEKKNAAQSASKAKRAQSYLDSGNALKEKNLLSGARKFWEKALAESPDSEAGKKAAELLKSHPSK